MPIRPVIPFENRFWLFKTHRNQFCKTLDVIRPVIPQILDFEYLKLIARNPANLYIVGFVLDGLFSLRNVTFFYFDGWLWPILACQRCFQLVAQANHVCWTGKKYVLDPSPQVKYPKTTSSIQTNSLNKIGRHNFYLRIKCCLFLATYAETLTKTTFSTQWHWMENHELQNTEAVQCTCS